MRLASGVYMRLAVNAYRYAPRRRITHNGVYYMNFSLKLISSLILIAAVITFLPLPASAATVPGSSGFRIVDCGGVSNPCTFNDMIRTVVRLINYLMSVAAIVAAYHIVSAGFFMMASMGSPEKLTEKKLAFSHAVIGFAIILLSFAFINLVLGLFGITCEWWTGPFTGDTSSLKCLY